MSPSLRRNEALGEDEPDDGDLPTYDATVNDPPSYGAQRLVSVTAVAAHLDVLRRFATIESSVRACSTGSLAPLSPSQRWAAYLRLAAVRLEKWVYLIAEARTTRRTWEEQVNALPDDVALVWHAWMIAAPRRYEDDVRRVWWDSLTEYGSAAGREAPLRGFPLILLARRFASAGAGLAEQEGQQLWIRKTGLAWDGLQTLLDPEPLIRYQCPACETELKTPALTPEGTGFCDMGFSAVCTNETCFHGGDSSPCITRETLGVKRLLDDLRLEPPLLPDTDSGWPVAKQRELQGKAVRRLAGGILSLTSDRYSWSTRPTSYSIVSATLVHRDFAKAVLRGPDNGEAAPASLKRLEQSLLKDTKLSSRVILHFLSAYTSPHAWSTDIAIAARRLSEFTRALDALGWLGPGWSTTNIGTRKLQQCIERYSRTLELSGQITAKGPLVVPLDVDLVWHTHLLQPSTYRRDVVEMSGTFLDHHDALEETIAAEAFDRLARAWIKSYKQQPFSAWSAPSAAGISARLKRLARTPAPLTALTAPESRPSTHSSVLVHVEKQAARRNRRIEGDLDPPFLRHRESDASDGQTDGIWCVTEATASLAGSNILGVDGFSPPTCWDSYVHHAAYRPWHGPSDAHSSVERDFGDAYRRPAPSVPIGPRPF
ncbi:hypothetical protein BMF94_4146 [Rhodotorula taiwanensis]|uniref:Uncharacterized protein n=1 Tax=Rhodotorula taiwanensis TaxID=741276 RepID=A0A2S5B7J3_9BASI|nr:hypothetical protein BMF94_4146 [Rhodotorula taiwanensis]